MTGDEMSVLFNDPHDLIDALEGRTVKADDDGCEAHGVLLRVTQRGEERDVGPGWSSPTIYMVDIVTPETGDLICRTDVRNFDLLEVVPMSVPTPSTDGAPEPEEVLTRHRRPDGAMCGYGTSPAATYCVKCGWAAEAIECWGQCQRCHEHRRLFAHGAMCQPCLDGLLNAAPNGLEPLDVIESAIDIGNYESTIAVDIMLALRAAGFRVVPEDRPAQAPSLEPVFAQLPSAPEIARWFVETEWAGKFQNLGGSAVTLSVDPWCSVWHLATVDHDEQMHYLLDVHTDGSHDLLYVTAGLREEMGCEWRQQPSDVMPWGYEALVWFAERIEFANESQGVPLVWMDALDNPLAAGVPALDDDTRRERLIEALDEFGDKVTQADAVIHLGRVQPEPFKSQMLDVAHALDEAQRLIRRAAAYLGGTDGR